MERPAPLFVVDTLKVLLHRLCGNIELFRNFLVSGANSSQQPDLRLARSELIVSRFSACQILQCLLAILEHD